jgi:protein-S-isoprenylcysteine O-methyltransferase Ste14
MLPLIYTEPAYIPWLRPQVTIAGIVVLLLTGLIGLGYRVRVEERALVEALGQPYVEYRRHTKRFIPFIF